jgi:hypothetical protein
MRRFVLVLVAAACGCGKSNLVTAPATAPPEPDAARAAAVAAPPDAAPPVAVAPPAPPDAAPKAAPEPAAALRPREGGPTMQACEQAADHLKELVVNSVVDSNRKERQYVTRLIEADREGVMRYCLEMAVPREIACVIAAKDMEGLSGCERKRQEIPGELVQHDVPTEADCAKFFDRLRQFKLLEGVEPAEIDKDRDQIIRTCQEKGKAGTIACFIASPTYEQARRCP